MKGDLITYAIPAFFLLIGIELLVAKHLQRGYYRLADSINDLSCGILSQLSEIAVRLAMIAGYMWLYEYARIATWPLDGWWVWLFSFLLVDFIYYWFHRLSHEINFLWAAHVVHHQSEEYNLTVALRQSAFQGWFSWFFYIPLALIGIHPLIFLTCSSINTLYQFWIHTRLVGKIPGFGWLFNTPSHHRVHHGRNPQYIDRNHAGTLIIWDKLFGTFEPEDEEVVYGITKPLNSWNPVYANFQTWQDLWQLSKRCNSMADKVRVFLKPPGWKPESLGGQEVPPPVTPNSIKKFQVKQAPGMAYYLFGQFVLLLGVTSWYLFLGIKGPLAVKIVGGSWILLSTLSLGWLSEAKSWVRWIEISRLLALPGLGALLGFPQTINLILAIYALSGCVILWKINYEPAELPSKEAL